MRLGWLKEWVERRPFQPFRIRTVDGSVYMAEHPDYISLDVARRAFVLWDANFNTAVLDSNLISAIEHAEFSDES